MSSVSDMIPGASMAVYHPGWPAGPLVFNMNMTFILAASLLATVFIIVFANIFGCWNDDNGRRRSRRYPRQSSARTRTKIKYPYPKPAGNVSSDSRIAGQSLQTHAHFADLASFSFDEGANIKGFTTAEDLREQARIRARMMKEACDLARSARKRGDHTAERRHNHEALAHEITMKHLNQAAAKLIFEEKNRLHPEGTVDLHGLYVEEAVEYAKQELQSASRRSNRVVHFIVGKGLHAKDGKVKIRPALELLCRERSLPYHLDSRNAGVLVVQC